LTLNIPCSRFWFMSTAEMEPGSIPIENFHNINAVVVILLTG